MLNPATPEQPIFQDGNVIVTRTLVRVSSKSYPINGIGSVDIKRPDITKQIFGGFVVALLSYGWVQGNHDDRGWWGVVIGIAIMAGAFYQPSHLVLRTASGDQQALESRDKAYLNKVKEAIEQAVVMRG